MKKENKKKRFEGVKNWFKQGNLYKLFIELLGVFSKVVGISLVFMLFVYTVLPALVDLSFKSMYFTKGTSIDQVYGVIGAIIITISILISIVTWKGFIFVNKLINKISENLIKTYMKDKKVEINKPNFVLNKNNKHQKNKVYKKMKNRIYSEKKEEK